MALVLPTGTYFGEERKQEENACLRVNITRYEPLTGIREHYHENAYLSLLINGHYQERHKREDRIVAPGEVIFRPAGYDHANHFGGQGGSCLNIEFRREALQELAPARVLPAKTTLYPPGAFAGLYRLLYCFVNDLAPGLPEEYLFHWLAESMAVKVPARLRWLPAVKAILENELDVHHSIASLAARVHVHPVYLARAFKEREGLTPGEYHLQVRVKKAMELLFRTQQSVSAIAYATGFADAAHLIRSFRLCYQVSPHKFRMALKS
ncbi:helix-turn-helix transcriptional regulator [Chitinophaga japonensis]|uniref:Helix-turn-helix protein n=1 Tax=Chitinophaga japonensis TaxID=104662 RepID=A0A562SSW1_CHIJA|nr:AraC family transcriptional regulator [Chitinophaga japonensis]TWI84104.1 helix-turn-helix protein [Chitinophaga japonensis]